MGPRSSENYFSFCGDRDTVGGGGAATDKRKLGH